MSFVHGTLFFLGFSQSELRFETLTLSWNAFLAGNWYFFVDGIRVCLIATPKLNRNVNFYSLFIRFRIREWEDLLKVANVLEYVVNWV